MGNLPTSNFAQAAIVEQTVDGELEQLVSYNILPITGGFEVTPSTTVGLSEASADRTKGASVDSRTYTSAWTEELQRTSANQISLMAALRMDSLTLPGEISFVGTADYNYDIDVTFDDGVTVGDRIRGPSAEFDSIVGLTGVELRMHNWGNAANGIGDNVKQVIILRVFEGGGESVIELIPASTGRDASAGVGVYGSAGALETLQSPTLRIGRHLFLDTVPSPGITRSFSALVTNTELNPQEFQAYLDMVIGDLQLTMNVDEKVKLVYSSMLDEQTAHLDSNPANPSGDPFVAADQGEIAATSRDFTGFRLLTLGATKYPLVFSCQDGAGDARGFTSQLTSNNFQANDQPCETSQGTGRGNVGITATCPVRLRQADLEVLHERLTGLGVKATRENVVVSASVELPLQGSEVIPWAFTWTLAEAVAPAVAYGFGDNNSFIDADPEFTALETVNYFGEKGFLSVQIFEAL